MSAVKHTIRRGSSGVVRRIDLRDLDECSESDMESIDGRGNSSRPQSVNGDSVSQVQTSTVANHAIEKLVIENNIFLKAALQLLDQRDRSIEDNAKTFKDGSTADVIICGKLKKASSGTVTRVWRDKFVELRHGVLCYEDVTGWGQKTNKKSIQLIAGQVICRPSTKYHGHVFEIRDLDSEGHVIHHHNKKKLFMVESSNDMGRWIEAIRTAMIGSAGDFGASVDSRSGSGGEESHTVRSDESDQRSGQLEDWRPLHTSQMEPVDSSGGKHHGGLPKLFHSRKRKKGSSHHSSEGVDSFSSEMKRFEHIERNVHAAQTPEAYRECLLDQSLDNVITIPVTYIRKYLRDSSLGNFSVRTTGSLSAQEQEKEKNRAKQEKREKNKQGKRIRKSLFGSSDKSTVHNDGSHNRHWNLTSRPTSIENSQAWKDLFRDTLTINGDSVNGGVEGPEAMIGALVRHILLQVQIMREKWVGYHDASPSSSAQTEQEAMLERAHMLATTYADMDEGQALSIARDVLLSCNRTESGGDTYYCTRSLLCNSNFAVLTPHGCDVEPIEISVDVVESARRRSALRPLSTSRRPVAESPATKDPSIFKQLSGIDEGGVSPRTMDSTTVESDARSDVSSDQNASSASQSHYPDSLLNAAADKVKQGGNHMGDMDDYYDSSQLLLESDIPGASANPSSMLLMKEVSKRKKRLSQPDYVEGSDSEISMCESVSGDSKSNTSDKDNDTYFMPSHEEKPAHHSFNGAEPINTYDTPTSHITPVFQVNCDDATVAVSELTMDTVSTAHKARRKTSLTSVFGKSSSKSSSPAPRKTIHSMFSGWSSAKGDDQSSESSRGLFSSRKANPDAASHSSWKSNKSYGNTDDDASSVTDHQRCQDEEEAEEETAAQSMCIRIQVIVKSRYRLCNLDPQEEDEDTWANITSQFHQNFYMKSNSNGKPAVSDRFVTLKVDGPSLKS